MAYELIRHDNTNRVSGDAELIQYIPNWDNVPNVKHVLYRLDLGEDALQAGDLLVVDAIAQVSNPHSVAVGLWYSMVLVPNQNDWWGETSTHFVIARERGRNIDHVGEMHHDAICSHGTLEITQQMVDANVRYINFIVYSNRSGGGQTLVVDQGFGDLSYELYRDLAYSPPASEQTDEEAATTTTVNHSGGGTINRNVSPANNAEVTKLGIYSLYARNYKLFLAKRLSSTSYEIVAEKTFAHAGAGMQYATLDTPYTTDATSQYFVGYHYTGGAEGLYVDAVENTIRAGWGGGTPSSPLTVSETTGLTARVGVKWLA